MKNVWMATVLGVAMLALAVPARAADLKVGDMAPNFKLQASDGKTYQLSDFKGKQAIVLAWFPKAYTRGCTIECKSLAEHGDEIRKYDVTYFMASVDKVEDNKGFSDQQHADFPLLADPTKVTAGEYGVLNQNGLASRWTFYIDKGGKITYIDKDVNAHLDMSAQMMAAKLGELGVPARRK